MPHVDSFVQRSEKKRRGERMKAVFRTDRGKVRKHNEDNGGVFMNQEGTIFAIVADGMGGHRAGDVASTLAVTKMKEAWDEKSSASTPDEEEKWLEKSINEVNTFLYKHAEENSECKGMGTTVVAAICSDKFVTIAHIGDSRIYLLNESGFKQLTEDHTLVNVLVKSGQISKEDAEHHPRKNVILRALGTEQQVEMDIKTIVFEEGDMLLLCSDGLSNKVADDEMERIITSDETLDQKADYFIKLANEYGGEDNITLILLEFDNESERG